MAEMIYQDVFEVQGNSRIDNVLQGKRIENLPDNGMFAVDVFVADVTDDAGDELNVRMELFIGNRAPIENSIVFKSALIQADVSNTWHDDRLTPDDMIAEAIAGYGGERLKLSLQNVEADPKTVLVKIVVNPAIV